MANDSTKVNVMKGDAAGYAFRAAKGTALPTDPAARTLAAAYVGLGYINSDGIVNSFSSDSDEQQDLNGTTVVTLKTSYSETFQFVLMESNEEAFKTFFGDGNVTTAEEKSEGGNDIRVVKHNSDFDGLAVYVFRMITAEDTDSIEYTDVCIPLGKVTERGDVTMSGTSLFTLDVTVSCQPDANGNTAYMYTTKVAK
jgi:hypothetical protein